MMKQFAGVVEGLILVVLGCYAGWLVLGDDYWRFLNPKFKWLTGLTAAMFLATGAVAVWNPNRQARLSRIIVFLIFVAFLGIEIHGREPRATQPHVPLQFHGNVEEVPRVTVDGIEYVLFVPPEGSPNGVSMRRSIYST